jgi:arylsulfatase A-like enzyme
MSTVGSNQWQSRRTAAILLLALGCLAPAAVHGGDGNRNDADKPNIVFVLADDLGWADVNRFDPKGRTFYETPNIDRLASQGMTFTAAYTNAANCSPTRAALLSGQYYPNQPVYHVGDPSRGKMIPVPNDLTLPAGKITIAESLKKAGYTTALIGKWHIGNPPRTGPKQQGFDVNIGGYKAGNPNGWPGKYFAPNNNPYIDDAKEGEYLTNYLTRKAVEFVKAHKDEPFYLQLSYYTPHAPYQAPKSLVEKYKQKEGEGGHDHPTYAAMIELLDRGVGRLMQALQQAGIEQNTIFVFYSDNGGKGSYDRLGRQRSGITDNDPLKSGKGSFYEGGIRVPLVVRWPGVTEPGSVTDEPVIGIDFYPTFLEAAGLGEPENYQLDGVSLMPVLRNREAELDREHLYWHFPGYPNAAWRTGPVSVIRSGPWKLMKFYEGPTLKLYNLSDDLGEHHDRAEDRPKVRKRLHRQLKQWLTKVDAPMPKRRDE